MDVEAFVRSHRVARLATATPDGAPHVVPVCYVYAPPRLYIALDEKPKRVPVTALRRVRNLLANPRVALVVDDFSEDWSQLAYVLLRGDAMLLSEGAEHAQAVALLRAKYPQYQMMRLEAAPLIAITVRSVHGWSAAGGSRTTNIEEVAG